MKNVTLLKILGALFVLPGFIFDVCVAFAFIINDGRPENHNGDFIAEWAFGVVSSFPQYLYIPFGVSVVVGILPAAIISIGIVLCVLFMLAYVLNVLIGSALQLPFTGRVRWVTLTSLTE